MIGALPASENLPSNSVGWKGQQGYSQSVNTKNIYSCRRTAGIITHYQKVKNYLPNVNSETCKYLSTMNETSMAITRVATMTATTARETETVTIHTMSPPPLLALLEGDWAPEEPSSSNNTWSGWEKERQGRRGDAHVGHSTGMSSKVIERQHKRGDVRICWDGTRDLYVVLYTQTKIQQLHVRAGFTGICVPQPQCGGTHCWVVYPAFRNDEMRLVRWPQVWSWLSLIWRDWLWANFFGCVFSATYVAVQFQDDKQKENFKNCGSTWNV